MNLNQTEQALERKVAFIDANRDLYLSQVHKADKSVKLGTICDSFLWHDKYDVLTSISDSKLHTYFYPNVVFIDSDLSEMTVSIKETSELCRLPQIINYTESSVTVRRRDGGTVIIGNSSHPLLLFEFCDKGKW